MSKRAHTLMEVVVVAGLSAMLVTVLLFAWVLINRSSRSQSARIDARQTLRSSLATLRGELQAARYVYCGYHNQFAHQPYNVPNPTGTPGPARDLLFAMPETPAVANMTWKICGLKIVKREPVDVNNPGAYDVLEQFVENVGPALFDDPAQLEPQLATLPQPVTEKRFQAYVDPSSFVLLVRPRPFSVFLHLGFRLRPTDVSEGANPPMMSETYETEIFLRNQPPVSQ